MICPFCGTENAEDAVFCKHCGKPVSGTSVCPACGKQTPADGEFCIYCGTMLRSTAIPYGTVQKAPKRIKQERTAEQKAAGAALRHKIFMHIGEAAALFAALMAFIFTFCIGIAVTGDEELSSMVDTSGYNLYYYFGGAYKDVRTMLDAALTYSPITEVSMLLPQILGTVVAAGTILGSVALFAAALTRYLRRVLGKTERSALPLAAWAFFVFAVGTAIFMGLNAATVSASYRTSAAVAVRRETFIAPNGATVAGLVLGAIGLAVSAVFSALARGKGCLAKQALAKYITAAAAMVFIIVILVLTAKPALTLTMRDGTLSNGLGFGAFAALQMFGALDLAAGGALSETTFIKESAQITAYSILGGFFLFVTAVMTAIVFVKLLNGAATDKGGKVSVLACAAVGTACAVLAAVFSALLAPPYIAATEELLFSPVNTTAKITAENAAPIACAVLCGVMLIGLIVYAALTKGGTRTAVPVQAAAVPVSPAQPAPADGGQAASAAPETPAPKDGQSGASA